MLIQEILLTVSNLKTGHLVTSIVKTVIKEKVFKDFEVLTATLLAMLYLLVLIVCHLLLTTAKNIIICGGPTFGINGNFNSPEIKFRINFNQVNANFA